MQIKEGETPGFLSLFCIPCLNSGISINLRNSNSKNHNIEEKHLNSSSLFFFIGEKERKTETVMYLKSFCFEQMYLKIWIWKAQMIETGTKRERTNIPDFICCWKSYVTLKLRDFLFNPIFTKNPNMIYWRKKKKTMRKI